MAMMYYVVTEGRANALDRLNLRDRSTYGLNWMAFYASSNADALRQWARYKEGRHSKQAELEAEAAQYRAATAGFAPPWEAEREAIALDAADRLHTVEAQQEVLRDAQADLEVAQKDLRRVAAAAPGARKRRRSSSPPPTPTTRRRTKA